MKLLIGLAVAAALATAIVFGAITSAQVGGGPDGAAIAPAPSVAAPPDLAAPPDNPGGRDLALLPLAPYTLPGTQSIPPPGGLPPRPSAPNGQSPALPPTPGTVPYPLH
jgi:hypothetical protein